jgi:hypothetical protein
MATGTKIGGGEISLEHRLIFAVGVLIGLLSTVGFALAPYPPYSVKELIKSVLKRV